MLRKDKPFHKSGRTVTTTSQDFKNAESSLPIHWCHREYKSKRLVEVEDFINVIALLVLFVLLIFAVVFFGDCQCLVPSLHCQCYCSYLPGSEFSACLLPLVNPVAWQIIVSAKRSLFRPRLLWITRRGLTVNRFLGVRHLPWQRVIARFDRRGNLKVEFDGNYEFVVKDDYEGFEQLRDYVVALAGQKR